MPQSYRCIPMIMLRSALGGEMPGSYGLLGDPAEPGISPPKAPPRQLKETEKKTIA